MDEGIPNSYKVTLKTGEHAIFTNTNMFEDYLDRLVSGIYGITTADNHNVLITLDSVLSIVQVCSHCKADISTNAGKRFCEKCQKFTWVSAPEYNS